MTLVCFLLPILFYSGVAEAAGTPKWVFLSIALPLLLLTRETKAHPAGLAFMLWASLSVFWAISWYEAVQGLWHLAIIACAFAMRLDEREYRRCLIAFGWGMAINAPIVVAQFNDWTWITQAVPPAGLFMNKNHLAEAALLASAGLIVAKHYWPLPLTVLATILPGSRGVFVAIAIMTAIWVWRQSRLAAVAIVLGGALIVWWMIPPGFLTDSSGARIALWANSLAIAWDNPLGVGIGNYWNAYPPYHDAVMQTPINAWWFNTRPEAAHNDAITLLVELGIPGLILFGMVLWTARWDWLLLAFILAGLFAYPFYLPATAVMAALCAGRAARGRGFHVGPVLAWRDGFLHRPVQS